MPCSINNNYWLENFKELSTILFFKNTFILRNVYVNLYINIYMYISNLKDYGPITINR